MSESPSPAGNAAGAGAGSASSPGNAAGSSSAAAAPKAAASQGNPAFRMMGLPRLRLPSRNWLIFLSITGSFASAVMYDKYQTRRIRDKWCKLVSHIADEHLDPHQMPRRMTIYLAAPPGDGLRAAREHFHNYIKPVLVAAAMDWDVVEGRKEGDVRYKTAERTRQRRRKAGEGTPDGEESDVITVEALRERSGTRDFDGVAGDLVVGRHTWKEYIRGLHEGWLGPVDSPFRPEDDLPATSNSESSPVDDSKPKDVIADANATSENNGAENSTAFVPEITGEQAPSEETPAEEKKEGEEKKEEEKPKRRHPPAFIEPSEYSSATVSTNIPDLIGPSIGINFPHILGFRNTPIRFYRFLNRRHLADSVGRDVATAVLASTRPYSSTASGRSEGTSEESPEQQDVLKHEERNWWKTTFQPRKEHEESVWIEDMVLDERVAGRMRAFQLTSEDETKAQQIWEGKH